MANPIMEKGYILALPRGIGDHNRISNDEIKTQSTQQLTQFRPHPHAYQFQDRYSRANENLPVYPIRPLTQEGIHSTTQILPDTIDKPWQVKTIRLDELVKKTYQLKNGNPDDHLKYISSMSIIESARFKVDPEYQTTLTQWIQDQNEPFQIRKQALLQLWIQRSVPFDQLLTLLSPNEKIQMIQNVLDNPKYRDQLLKDKSTSLRLIIALRNLNPLREQLKKGFSTPQVEDILQLESQAQGTEIEAQLKKTLPLSYALALNNETRLGSKLSQLLGSSNPAFQDFGQRILNEAKENPLSKFKIIEAFEEINSLKTSNAELKDFNQAATAWLKLRNVSPDLKSHFLLSQFGSSLYETYFAALQTKTERMDAYQNI